MAAINYLIKEFTPTQTQVAKGMTHSFYPQEVPHTTINNVELAKKIEARTGNRRYEIMSDIAALMEVSTEEILEGNRVQFEDGEGNMWLSMVASCKGGVSDAEVLKRTTAQHEIDQSIPVRSVAQESDVTSDDITWNISVTVGRKFLKKFNLEKTTQKVKPKVIYVTETSENGGGDNNGNNGGGSDDGMLG